MSYIKTKQGWKKLGKPIDFDMILGKDAGLASKDWVDPDAWREGLKGLNGDASDAPM